MASTELERPNSVTDICNMALILLDQNTIASLQKFQAGDNSSSTQAKYCAFFYPHCKADLLSRYPWSFAKREAKLDSVKENTIYVHGKVQEKQDDEIIHDYDHCFKLPEDCLAVGEVFYTAYKRQIVDQQTKKTTTKYTEMKLNGPNAYVIVGRYLKTNRDSIKLRYIADVSNIKEFSPQFITCLAIKLATWMVKQFDASSTYLQQLEMLFQQAWGDATHANAKDTTMKTIVWGSPLLAEIHGISPFTSD